QEVAEAALTLDYDFSGVDKPKSDEDLYGLRYSAFVIPLVKSVQELSSANKELKESIELLRERRGQQVRDLKEMIQKLSGKGVASTTVRVTGAYLLANAPNPFTYSTIIRYHVPEGVGGARLLITDMKGRLVKTINLWGSGVGQYVLSAGSLAQGSYTYTLWIGEEKLDSKQMIIVR
ncbi:MAG TPA: hypothetical protein VM935_15490, partial [Chitinophagaceae bacterium]|nr:hypothetical protein [Chitinophagaceae bacterium]